MLFFSALKVFFSQRGIGFRKQGTALR